MSAASNELTIIDSTICNIKLNVGVGGGGNVFISTGNISVINMAGGSSINLGGRDIMISTISGNQIRVGVGSSMSVNGYGIQGFFDKTIVTTPSSAMYENGRKISGNGPDTFAGYKLQNRSAPNITGPGWTDGKASATSKAAPAAEPSQIIILQGASVVTGIVTFNGGNGRIIVKSGAQFTGTVQGGIVTRE